MRLEWFTRTENREIFRYVMSLLWDSDANDEAFAVVHRTWSRTFSQLRETDLMLSHVRPKVERALA